MDAASATTLFVVRHAEKADDGTSDPPLTADGTARAERLAAMLRDAQIDAAYATGYRRTQATAAPLAEAAGISVTTYEEQGGELADLLLERHAGETVLVAGHSNTVPMLLNALVGDERFVQLAETEYDALFVVVAHTRGAVEVVPLRF